MTSRSSSVSRPHFSLAWPLNCFQFPSTRFQSMTHSFLLVSFCFDLIAAAELPAASASYASARVRKPAAIRATLVTGELAVAACLITPASTGAAEEQENPWSRGHP